MCAFGSRPGSQKPGPAPRHLGLGHVRRAARLHKPREAASGGGRPRASLAVVLPSCGTDLSAHPKTSLPRWRHARRSWSLPGEPSWMAQMPLVSPTCLPCCPQNAHVHNSSQTRRAGPHQPTEGTRAGRCSSQNPYQGAFLVERTENNKRQRNEPERDRKRVAGR